MAGKIFYRERLKVGEKERKPRFALLAVTGVQIEFYSTHLRKKELDLIAKELGAELILIPHDPKDKDKDEVEIKK